jgi:hypothetical protein
MLLRRSRLVARTLLCDHDDDLNAMNGRLSVFCRKCHRNSVGIDIGPRRYAVTHPAVRTLEDRAAFIVQLMFRQLITIAEDHDPCHSSSSHVHSLSSCHGLTGRRTVSA